MVSLNQTAAILMASAVTELFPGTLLIEGQGTPDFFYYDFLFPFEFQEDFLTLIEERMRLIIREKRAVKLLEMMPANAASMLRHRGQILAADRLDAVERAVVEMCQIGDFAAYSPVPFLKDLSIPFIKILEGFPLGISGRKTIRIVGAAALQKDVLKLAAKKQSVSERSHLTLAREMQLFEPLEDLWMWRAKGVLLRKQLLRIWQEEHVKQKFELIASPIAFLGEGTEKGLTTAHVQYFLQTGAAKVAEVALVTSSQISDPAMGLFSPGAYFADQASVFCADEKLLEECISSLHFILKIPKILGFEFEIVLSISSEGSQKARSKATAILREALEKAGAAFTTENDFRSGILASIDVRIADALGRRWTGPSLRIPEVAMPSGKGSMLIRCAFSSLERIAALLLEKSGGLMPLCVAPEQVRILVATSKSNAYAAQVCKKLQAQEFRATLNCGDGSLKERVYQALKEKVPYILLLGEREEKEQTLTVRSLLENKEQTLSFDEFCMRMKSELGSFTSELTN